MPSLAENSWGNGGIASFLATSAVSAAVLLAAVKIARKISRPALDLSGKITLITGGSRGLGFALAQEIGRRGGRLALCARDSDELYEACGRLAQEGIEAVAFPADIAQPGAIAPLVAGVIERFGRIDILINDAGLIKVGPVENFDHSDFEEAMDLMFWAPLNLTFAVLPHMKNRGEGHIVNITSVGGRVSVPHLLPYSCAKFAMVGFSTGLSAELGSKGIHVLTVIPGLMRTGSYFNAKFTGEAKEEFAWFGLLGNLPGFSVAADYAATCIRRALENRRHNCTISLPAKLMIACEAVLPEATRSVLELLNSALLPAPDGRTRAVSGKFLNPHMNRLFQALTSLGRIAAHDLNE